MKEILKLDHIQKYYGNSGNVTKAIQDISFSVQEGEFVGIMGASGSGKTTLLNCISTIDMVSAGHIYLDGTDVTEINEKQIARFRRENLGFVFQDFNLLDTLTISENIALALTINKVPAGEVDGRVREMAGKLNITDILDKYPYQVSGGQKQRCACARAIINQPAETPILTEPMEQYQMAGTKGYVLVLPDEAASQLVGEKIRLALKLKDGGYPELKSDLKQFLNSGKWQLELQSGQQLPEKVTMGVTVKAWGIANSLTGFTAISFCGLYLSIIFIILSCSVLAFEQLSAIDKNQKNYAVIDRLGVPSHRQASLIRRELSTVFLIPLLFPLLLTVLLIAGAQFFFGEAILQQGLVPLYGLVTILLFCAIYLTYFGATMFLFKRVILRPEMR